MFDKKYHDFTNFFLYKQFNQVQHNPSLCLIDRGTRIFLFGVVSLNELQ